MSDLMFSPILAKVGTEYILFGAAGVVSLVAFATLILAPTLGSFSRPWEKIAAGFLSLFVLAALILIGLAIGFAVFYNWDKISG
jgi:NADH:ubiquinone oxidoreductase subunit K